MKVTIRTLTPLWTGGVHTGHMDRIHETGLIGSLRWWYEAIVRGLGGDVCSPTSNDSCPRRRNGQEEYCPACKLFGATGQRRKFRLRLGGGEHLFQGRNIPIPSGRIRSGRTGGWYLMGDSMVGDEIPLSIIPLDASEELSSLQFILAIIDRHAALGAKVSNGYGVIETKKPRQPPLSIEEALPTINPAKSPPQRDSALPDIRDFFFAKLQFQPPGNDSWWQETQGIAQSWAGQVQKAVHRTQKQRNEARTNLQALVEDGLLPLAPAVRNWLRYQWESDLSTPQKDYLFGTTKTLCPHCCQSIRKDKKNRKNYWCNNCRLSLPKEQTWEGLASKINVSYAYRLGDGHWQFRVWGWVPSRTPDYINLKRDRFLKDLYAALTSSNTWQWVFNKQPVKPELNEWHTGDSHRQDGLAYLKELLVPDERGAA